MEETRTVKKKARSLASDETVVYLPNMGFVKVGDLKTKWVKEAKVKAPPSFELEKAVVAKVIERGGRVTRPELAQILREAKQGKGMKRGVTLNRLTKDNFLARVKVPKMKAFYAVTKEGAEKAGITTEEKPVEE